MLKETGIAIVIAANAEHCIGEWASYTFLPPEGGSLKSGGQVELLIRGTEIRLYDYVWFHSDFEETFQQAGLVVERRHEPMITGLEPYKWYQELERSFWDVYILRKAAL